MEKPTTDEVGSPVRGENADAEAPVEEVDGDEKRDAHNFGVDGFATGVSIVVAADSVVEGLEASSVVMSPRIV